MLVFQAHIWFVVPVAEVNIFHLLRFLFVYFIIAIYRTIKTATFRYAIEEDERITAQSGLILYNSFTFRTTFTKIIALKFFL